MQSEAVESSARQCNARQCNARHEFVEVYKCRLRFFSFTQAAGALLPEVLTKAGLISVPVWYDAGAASYFAPTSTLFVIQFLLFHYVEVRRWQGRPALKALPAKMPETIIQNLSYFLFFWIVSEQISNILGV